MISNDILLVGAFIVAAVAAVAFAIFQNRARDEWMARTAERRGGQIRKGSFFKVTEMLIQFQGETVIFHMEPGSKHSSPKTVATVNLASPRLPTLRLVHNGMWQKMIGSFGQERVNTGDEEFDSQWVIRSDDEFAARKLASPDLKTALSDRLFRHLDLRLDPQQMKMVTLALPSNEEHFEVFVDAAILVLKKLL
jgi:hypothetical protein